MSESPIENVLDEMGKIIIDNKRMVAFICLFLIACFIGTCVSYSPEDCSDEIVQVDNAHCYNGAKLKHIDNQWICSCSK